MVFQASDFKREIEMKYIAKPDTWFKTGTECVLEEFLYESPGNGKSGIFRGIRVCENPLAEGGINPRTGKPFHEVGEEYEKSEVCSYNEFEIIYVEEITEREK